MSDDLKVVRVYGDLIEAQLARIRLEEAGIDALLLDTGLVTANPLLAPAVGGIRVAVRACDLEAAAELLGAVPESVAKAEACPACQSTKIVECARGLRFAFLSILFLGFPIGRSRREVSCQDCGHRWRE